MPFGIISLMRLKAENNIVIPLYTYIHQQSDNYVRHTSNLNLLGYNTNPALIKRGIP